MRNLYLEAIIRRVFSGTRKCVRCEAHLMRKNGQHLPVALRFFPLISEGVMVVGVDDISTRRTTEEFLRQSKEEFLAAFDSIDDMILLESATGELRRCNNAVSTFTSRPVTELIGRSTTEVLFGDLPDAPRLHLLARESSVSVPREIVFPGSPDFYELRSYWIPQERGIGSSWVHVLKNITSIKKAEQQMALLTTVAEQTTDMVAILDLKGHIRYLNPSLENLIGLTQGQVADKSFRELHFRPCDWDRHRQILRKSREGEALTGDYRFRKPDGSVHFLDVLVSPLNDVEPGNSGFIVIGRDITHRKRLESIAEAVNVMENVGYIFSGIRHEMGNPINSIKISLAVLKQNFSASLPDEAMQYVNRSLEEVERVEYLLKALRSFSMHEDVNLEETRLNSFLDHFCELAKVDFAKNDIQVESRLQEPEVTVRCDPRALHQILLNLFTNAAQAMEKRDPKAILVELETVGDFARILVHDTGIGMSEAQLELLFKPFHTSKAEGTGLGMVIVKKMITKMNGTIDIKSRPGRGTTIILTFEILK